MKFRILLFYFFLSYINNLSGQNLVNNPSFEEHDCSGVHGITNKFFEQALLKWTTPTWYTSYCTSFCPDLAGNPRDGHYFYQTPHT